MKELRTSGRASFRRGRLTRYWRASRRVDNGVGQVEPSISSDLIVYRVGSDRATTYCVSKEVARDKVIAYAMLDELAFVEPVRIPSRFVGEEVDGTVEILEAFRTLEVFDFAEKELVA